MNDTLFDVFFFLISSPDSCRSLQVCLLGNSNHLRFLFTHLLGKNHLFIRHHFDANKLIGINFVIFFLTPLIRKSLIFTLKIVPPRFHCGWFVPCRKYKRKRNFLGPLPPLESLQSIRITSSSYTNVKVRVTTNSSLHSLVIIVIMSSVRLRRCLPIN